jgi:hypothetical protein
VIRFIAEHKDHQVAGPDGGAGLRWGVEPMCAVVSEHGVPMSASTYYEWIAKTPTRRQMRDAELVEIITAARADRKSGKFVQTLGSRTLWIWPRGQGHDVARCTVERIMREQGWEGGPSRIRSLTRKVTVHAIPTGRACVCGHDRDAHEHLRPGSQCSQCAPGGCVRYRRATLLRRLLGWRRAR